MDSINNNNGDTLLPSDRRAKKAEKESKCCFGILCFVLNLGVLNILAMILTVLNTSVVRTLEKRFSLKSTETGTLWSMNDVTHIFLVVFIGYFGRNAHKPKIISVTMVFAAMAGYLMALPYFLFPDDSEAGTESISNLTISIRKEDVMCVSNSTQGEDKCIDENGMSTSQGRHPAFYIFFVAQLLAGIGGSAFGALGMAYIDENSPKEKAALYIGINVSLFAIGPVLAHLLSAVTLSLPENLTQNSNLTREHPMWIGCWWLGYMIVAVGLTLALIPMWFFPKHIKKQESREEEAKSKRRPSQAVAENIKSMPKMFIALMKNWPYVIMIFCGILFAYIIQAMLAPMVRYIEVHFMVPAYKAALFTGGSSAGGGLVGGFLGGALMSGLKLKPRGAVILLIGCGIISLGCVATAAMMKCPQPQLNGEVVDGRYSFSVKNTCNDDCSCPTGRGSYSPVCGSDGISYYSPCFAGCTSQDNNTFHDCACIGTNNVTVATSNETPYESMGWANRGLCPIHCNTLIPYCVAILLLAFVGSVSRVPGTVILLRIVKPEEKSFALGVNSFAMNLFGMIPGPILIGALIDTTCKLWQRNCNGSGVCLLFDTTKLRLSTYGLTLACFAASLVLSIPLLHFISKMPSLDEPMTKEVKAQAEEEELVKKVTDLDKLKESHV